MKNTKGSSGKRLIRNQSPTPTPDMSNHTEILEDIPQELDDFRFDKKKQKPKITYANQSVERKEVVASESKEKSKNPPKPQKSTDRKPNTPILPITSFFQVKRKDDIQPQIQDKKISFSFNNESEILSKKQEQNKEPARPPPIISESPLKVETKQAGKSYKAMFDKQQKNDKIPLTGDQLKGETIVITGIINICPREKLEETLKQFGAKLTGSVSGKTTVLIAGEKLEDSRSVEQGNKYKTAQAKGTKIIPESQLSKWLFDLTGVSLDQIFGESQMGKLYNDSLDKALGRQIEFSKQDQWADRHQPRCLPDLVGHKSSIEQLFSWLKNWGRKQEKEEKKKNTFMMMQMGRFQITGDKYSKACMISGPPGIGKSSSVRILCDALGYEILGTNASEQRNKSSVRSLLSHLIGNKLLVNRKVSSRFIILMDEVDGMTGSDRGGIQQLIESIKNTQIPIVCVCNDHESQKLRTLLTYCYHIKFAKPSAEEVSDRLFQIASQEKLKVSPEQLTGIARIYDNDIRQCINTLQMLAFGKANQLPDWKRFSKDKVAVMNVFEAAISLLNEDKRKDLRFRQQLDCFFLDYDLMPLIVQDSYLSAMKIQKSQTTKKKKETKKQGKDKAIQEDSDPSLKTDYNLSQIQAMAQAAESIQLGDILNRSIRWKQNWGLMPAYGQKCIFIIVSIFSTIYPCHLVGQQLGFPKFPEFLGKTSTKRKVTREVRGLKNLIAKATYNASVTQIKFEYGPILFRFIELVLRGKFAHSDKEIAIQAVRFLENYNLTPEDLKISLHDMQFNPQKLNLLALIDVETKKCLTRTYNQRHAEIKIAGKKAKAKGENNQTENEIQTVYNPAVGEEGPIYDQQQQNNQSNESEDHEKESKKVSKKKPKAPQKSNTSKQQKKQTKRATQDSESENSLQDFIDDS